MITNKDIRVENGNLVLNGDKFPLDGQTPETIMGIVEDNSDTTPTENSTAPVTSGGLYTAFARIKGQIGELKFAVFEQNFTGVDITNAWGSMYESTSTLSFDISSLGLQNAPKSVSVSLKPTGAAVLLTAPTATATAINFRAVRPSTATDLNIVATALVIY